MATLQQQDPYLQTLAAQLQSSSSNPTHQRFMIIDNVIHYISQHSESRIYVPTQLRHAYLEFYHNHPFSGHLGFHKVLEKIRLHYYWPQMRKSITTHLLDCTSCQQTKTPPRNVGHLTPITVSAPFELVGWDLMGPFPETSRSNRYIIVMTEYLMRWYEATAVPDSSAHTVANTLLHKLILSHGCPKQLLSDQGKQFAGEVMEVLTSSLGIRRLLTSPYHPQTNGLTERMNKTLKQMIAAYVDPLQSDWDQILPFVVHAHNTSVQASTRISPFRALYGRDPRLPPDLSVTNTPHSHIVGKLLNGGYTCARGSCSSVHPYFATYK